MLLTAHYTQAQQDEIKLPARVAAYYYSETIRARSLDTLYRNSIAREQSLLTSKKILLDKITTYQSDSIQFVAQLSAEKSICKIDVEKVELQLKNEKVKTIKWKWASLIGIPFGLWLGSKL